MCGVDKKVTQVVDCQIRSVNATWAIFSGYNVLAIVNIQCPIHWYNDLERVHLCPHLLGENIQCISFFAQTE